MGKSKAYLKALNELYKPTNLLYREDALRLLRVVKGAAIRSASLMNWQVLTSLPQEMRQYVMLKFRRTLPPIKAQMMTFTMLIAYWQRSKKMAERTT